MAQLVGQPCVHCGDRIPDELNARFCSACRSPLHNRCARAGGEGDCTSCGAPGRYIPPPPEPIPQPSEPTLEPPTGLEAYREVPAGFWIRAVAAIIDAIVMAPITYLSYLAMIKLHSPPLVLILFIPQLLYKPLMESRYAATLGKFAVGVRVVNRDGNRIGIVRAYLRFSPWLLEFALTVLVTIWLFSAPGYSDAETMSEMGELAEKSPYDRFMTCSMWLGILDCALAAVTVGKRAFHDLLAETFCVRLVPKQ